MSNVDHPAHYNQLGFEVWDIVKHLDFATGNVVKYILRAPFKGSPVEDLKKALWYARHADRGKLGFINESCSEAARMIGETLKNMNFDIPLEVAINNLYALISRMCSVDEFIKLLERDVEMCELVSYKPENKEDEMDNTTDNKETFDFGTAIRYLKEGKLVSRAGWNGKGMFLFLQVEKKLYNPYTVESQGFMNRSFMEWFSENGDWESGIKMSAVICMKAADGTVVRGWLASQTDMLAEDWFIFE